MICSNSSVGLERTTVNREVRGSTPLLSVNILLNVQKIEINKRLNLKEKSHEYNNE